MSEKSWEEIEASLPPLFRNLVESARMSKCTIESHEEAKKDDSTWLSMAYVGIQETDQGFRLELRNCKCGSTLAKKIPCQS